MNDNIVTSAQAWFPRVADKTSNKALIQPTAKPKNHSSFIDETKLLF